MGKLRSNCWAIFKKDHDEWLRHFLGKLWKKPPSSFRNLFKMCLMGILMGSFRTYSQFAHWSSHDQSDGLFSKKFKICPLGIWWVNCLKDQKKIKKRSQFAPWAFAPLPPVLPALTVDTSLEFWRSDSSVMNPERTLTQSEFWRLSAQRSEGGEEMMREGLWQAAEEADQPLEEHLRRSGVAILRVRTTPPN